MKRILLSIMFFQCVGSGILLSQVTYFPLKGEVLIGPENVAPAIPEQATFYLEKYQLLADSIESTFEKYKAELKLGVPRTEILLTYREMRRNTRKYIRMWKSLERNGQKHRKLARQAFELQKEGRKFTIKSGKRQYESDSLQIELEQGLAWEEITNLLDVTEYEKYLVEDNMQWEKVSAASNPSARLNGGYQFKKKPYEGYRIVNEYEGCLSHFESFEDECVNTVSMTKASIILRIKSGQIIYIDKLLKK